CRGCRALSVPHRSWPGFAGIAPPRVGPPGGRPWAPSFETSAPVRVTADRGRKGRALAPALVASRVALVVQTAAIDAISKSIDPPSSLRGTSGRELPHAPQSPFARNSDHPLPRLALGRHLSGACGSEGVLRKTGEERGLLRRDRTPSRCVRPDGRDGMERGDNPASAAAVRPADRISLGLPAR